MTGKNRQSAYLSKKDEWKALYESGLSYTKIGKMNGVHYTTVQKVLKGVVTPRPKQKFAHLAKEFVKLYTVNELSINGIAERFQTDPNTVSKYLKQEGVTLRRTYGQSSPFEKDIPKWISAYQNGKSLKEIADDYQTFPQTVHKHIQDKVAMREYTETSQVYIIQKPDYLKTIDSHEKAYWLGIWFGTGFLSKSVGGYEATLNLGIKDRIIVERFKEVIGYEKPLEEYQEKEVHVIRMRIHNKVFYDTLLAQGLRGEKNVTLSFPEALSAEFYNSFILGFYEGKGSCCVTTGITKGKKYAQISFQLFGTQQMVEKLKSIIETSLNLNINQGINKVEGKRDVHYIGTNAKSKVEKIAKWLYSGKSTYTEHRDIRTIIKEV